MPRPAFVDNAGMPALTDWQPVIASHTIAAGVHVVAARLCGQDLAVWRSAAGLVQVWHDSCPHRGVQLSLGRVKHDRLACAYHGWEFEAGGGQCRAIPALADLATPPGKVCARTFPAIEAQGMVWVQLQKVHGHHPTSGLAAPATSVASGTFLRSLALDRPESQLATTLRACGMAQRSPYLWTGSLAGHPARFFTSCIQDSLVMLHAWLEGAVSARQASPLFAALQRLRKDAEAVAP
jgi:nitrite reductase/ring-hydroxylating ferredoxin subunit